MIRDHIRKYVFAWDAEEPACLIGENRRTVLGLKCDNLSLIGVHRLRAMSDWRCCEGKQRRRASDKIPDSHPRDRLKESGSCKTRVQLFMPKPRLMQCILTCKSKSEHAHSASNTAHTADLATPWARLLESSTVDDQIEDQSWHTSTCLNLMQDVLLHKLSNVVLGLQH